MEKQSNLSHREFMKRSMIIGAGMPVAAAIKGPDVLNTIEEADGISTNAVAQWWLTAMDMLDFVGDAYNK